jgi:hypothetical protein
MITKYFSKKIVDSCFFCGTVPLGEMHAVVTGLASIQRHSLSLKELFWLSSACVDCGQHVQHIVEPESEGERGHHIAQFSKSASTNTYTHHVEAQAGVRIWQERWV